MKLWEEWKEKADEKGIELEKVYKLLEAQQEISDDLRKEIEECNLKIQKYERFLDDANLCYECGHSDRTCNHA